jgi:hypothetical protein
MSPDCGPVAGGTIVTLIGSGFGDPRVPPLVRVGRTWCIGVTLSADGCSVSFTVLPGQGRCDVLVVAALTPAQLNGLQIPSTCLGSLGEMDGLVLCASRATCGPFTYGGE